MAASAMPPRLAFLLESEDKKPPENLSPHHGYDACSSKLKAAQLRCIQAPTRCAGIIPTIAGSLPQEGGAFNANTTLCAGMR
jgi:hypothetical protein